jgi:hypothetical protein
MRLFWISIVVLVLTFATRFILIVRSELYSVPRKPPEPRVITRWSQVDDMGLQMGEMEKSAIKLATEGRIANIQSDDSGPSAHVAPLYAWFLAILYQVVGPDLARFRFAYGIAAAAATALAVALLPALGRRARLSGGAGILAAILAMCSPLTLGLEIVGEWEHCAIPLALIAVFWAFLALHDRAWADTRLGVVAGLALGVGSLLSPLVLLTGLVAMAVEVMYHGVRSPRLAVNAAVVLALCGLILSPWIHRNYRAFSSFVPVRSNFGLELAVGNNPSADGLTPPGRASERHPGVNPSECDQLKAMGEVAYYRMRLDEARGWIASNPQRFLKLCLRRARLYWFADDPRLWSGGAHVPWSMKFAGMATITLLAFGGLAWLLAVRHPYRYLFACAFLGPSIPFIVTHVSLRYRYPIMGLTYLLGSECLVRLVTSLRNRLRWRGRRRAGSMVRASVPGARRRRPASADARGRAPRSGRQ